MPAIAPGESDDDVELPEDGLEDAPADEPAGIAALVAPEPLPLPLPLLLPPPLLLPGPLPLPPTVLVVSEAVWIELTVTGGAVY